jgi:DNA polymerase-4
MNEDDYSQIAALSTSEDGVHPSLRRRKIIHFDMDAFYASVEIRDRPELRGKPVIVGGSPDSRSVVCTASYEARKFGIRSAMACSVAKRLCPQAIFLPVDFAKYREASGHIREIFSRYTPLIEPMSLDEAYLDVTENAHGWYASRIAREIQQAIFKELKLTGSAGVAPNKLVAKIASDFRKPFGITVVTPEQVNDFMRVLPLRRLHGVGPATEKRLLVHGLKTCEDVWKHSTESLANTLGPSSAEWLLASSRGIDEREVCTHWERKSLGREETFERDVESIDSMIQELKVISESVESDLRDEGKTGRTVTLKVKYADFQSVTRRLTLESPIDDASNLFEISSQLLLRTEAGKKKVRLLGISVSNFSDQVADAIPC